MYPREIGRTILRKTATMDKVIIGIKDKKDSNLTAAFDNWDAKDCDTAIEWLKEAKKEMNGD